MPDHDRNERWHDQQLSRATHALECLCCELKRIANLLERKFFPVAVRATLVLYAVKSDGGFTMPATVVIGGTAISTFTEFDANNNVVPNSPQLTFASDNPAVATVDPVSGTATGVSAGTCNITGTDPTNGNVTASDVLTVTPPAVGPAVRATEVLTAVTPQLAAAAVKHFSKIS